MRNLKYYSKSPIGFYDLVIKNKNTTKGDLTYKDRVKVLRVQIEEEFNKYDLLFDNQQLINAVRKGFADQNKIDLLNLYSYSSKTVQELKIAVTTLENNRILNTCQNCTINEVNSFDHFLPKDEFAEFVVHPKNLIPSCTVCNSRKSVNWRDDNSLLYLNIYSDELPVVQYLFVNITVEDDVIVPKFYLDNRNNIDVNIYDVISSHYKRLKLTNRFRGSSDNPTTELENLVKAQKFHLSKEAIIDVVERKVAMDKTSFGHNYWRAILQQELINSNIFMDRYFV